MRKLVEIIEDLKDGKKVDYEEARLAAIVFSDLLFFSNRDFEQVMRSDNKLVRLMVEENHNERYPAALNKSPEDWLGNNHPDNPEEQKRRRLSKKIFDRVTESRKEMKNHEQTGIW